MNFRAGTVRHSLLLPHKDWGYQRLQTSNNTIDTGTIFPLPTCFPSASLPLPILPAPSQISVTSAPRSSPCPTASASPGIRPETVSGTKEECNADRPSDEAQGQPQGSKKKARINSSSSSIQPQSRRARKEQKEFKPIRRGQGRPRCRKSRVRKHLTDKEKAAAKLNRRARKNARREATAAELSEKRESRAADEDKEQRKWLEARWRKDQPAVLYKPPGSGAKSAPGQRLVIVHPWQYLSVETDEDDWYDDDDDLSDEEMIQKRLNGHNNHEHMRTAPEQNREDGESWYEPRGIAPEQETEDDRADDSYDLGNESVDSGEETLEEDWSNIDPKTLLAPGIATTYVEETESGESSLRMSFETTLESYFDCDL